MIFLSSSKLRCFYLQSCLLDSPWQRHSVNELSTRRGRTPGTYAVRCLTFWLSSASVACTFLSMMDALYGFLSQPPRFEPGSPGNTRTHSGGSLFPLFWQRVIERSDVIERVKAQHSDSDALRRTLLVSFPVVVETCWDFFSNKTRTHQSTPGRVPACGDHPFDPQSTWVHAVVQKGLPSKQLLGLGHNCFSSILNVSASWTDLALLINQLNVHFDWSLIITGITAIVGFGQRFTLSFTTLKGEAPCCQVYCAHDHHLMA